MAVSLLFACRADSRFTLPRQWQALSYGCKISALLQNKPGRGVNGLVETRLVEAYRPWISFLRAFHQTDEFYEETNNFSVSKLKS